VTDEDAFQSLIQETFNELSAKMSYAVDWIDTFLSDFKGCVNEYKAIADNGGEIMSVSISGKINRV
jgi:hypothetical protein